MIKSTAIATVGLKRYKKDPPLCIDLPHNVNWVEVEIKEISSGSIRKDFLKVRVTPIGGKLQPFVEVSHKWFRGLNDGDFLMTIYSVCSV